MNRNLMITISVLLFASIIGVFLFTRNTTQNTTLVETDSEIGEEITLEEVDKSSDPESAVDTFLTNFILSGPPSANEEAVENAASLLSEGAKMGMEDEPTSGDLARFVGVQDLPDNGYEIGNVVYKDNVAADVEDGLAEVEVTFKYSGGDVVKTFLLSMVEESWQIDGVKQE
jgi:hypothetical protein